jgi:hypothetical protein
MGLIRQSRYCRTILCLLAVMWAFLAFRISQRPANPAPSLLSTVDPALVADDERLAGLDRTIPSLSLANTGLGDAIDLLGRKTGAKIVVRWSKLNELHLTPQTPITLSLHDVTLATALRVILRQASLELQYGIAPGARVVVTRGWTDAPKTIAVYDLRSIDPAATMYMSSVGLQPTPASQVEFVRLLPDFLITGEPPKAGSPSTQVVAWGSRLIAMETPENQRRLRVIMKGFSDTGPRFERGETATPPKSQFEQLVEQHMAEIHFDGVSLESAIDDLRERSKANIVVNWAALKTVGVERSTVVRVRLWGVPLRLALWALFSDDRDGHPALDFDIEENVLTITNGIRTHGDVKVYDVRDLVEVAIARRRAVESAAGRPPTSASTGSNPFTEPPSAAQIEQEESEKLSNLIHDAVDPVSWSDYGGSGVIHSWSGRLMVRTSPMIHKHIEEFLQRVRESLRAAATQPSAGDNPDAKK